MTTQPEAQRLLEKFFKNGEWTTADQILAAAELRRLHEANQELMEALLKAAQSVEALKRECSLDDPESPRAIRNTQYMNISYAVRAAIAKATGEQA